MKEQLNHVNRRCGTQPRVIKLDVRRNQKLSPKISLCHIPDGVGEVFVQGQNYYDLQVIPSAPTFLLNLSGLGQLSVQSCVSQRSFIKVITQS